MLLLDAMHMHLSALLSLCSTSFVTSDLLRRAPTRPEALPVDALLSHAVQEARDTWVQQVSRLASEKH